MVVLEGDALLAWLERTSTGWRDLVTAHPEALCLPCDVRETTNVAELLQHIVAVELRYAERLNDSAVTPYENVPYDSAEAIFTTHDRAITLLRVVLPHDAAWWAEWVEITTRSAGKMRAARRAVLVHLCMHSIRHYAQLATLVRQHGIKPDWSMDYLFMEAEAT